MGEFATTDSISYFARVLIARQKEILIGGQVVRLYSVDGRLWVSRPDDVKVFKQRRAAYIASVQNAVATHLSPLPLVVPYRWMGYDR